MVIGSNVMAAKEMKIALIAVTKGGEALATRLAQDLPQSEVLKRQEGIAATLAEHWSRFDAFVCIMATGIVVRAIAPLVVDKKIDPCVLVVDEKGQHVISLLAGHLGGGNELARQVAALSNGRAVITTASDTLGLVALDLWAQEQGLVAEPAVMTKASGRLVNNGELTVYAEVGVDYLPTGLIQVATMAAADLCITPRLVSHPLVFRPQNLVIGTGCNRGTPMQEFQEALAELLADCGLAAAAIRNLASIDQKNNETGLLDFARHNQWPLVFFSKDEINLVGNIQVSTAAMAAVGAKGVAEPCALLSAGQHQSGTTNGQQWPPMGGEELVYPAVAKSPARRENITSHGRQCLEKSAQEHRINLCSLLEQKVKLLSRKRKWQNITMAIAQVPFTLSAPAQVP